MIKADLAAPQESVAEGINYHNPQGSSQRSLGFRPTFCLPENFWIIGIPKLLRHWYGSKYSYSALLHAHTQSPKQQLITQEKGCVCSLIFFFPVTPFIFRLSFYNPLCCDRNSVTLGVSASFLTYSVQIYWSKQVYLCPAELLASIRNVLSV